MAKSKQNTRVVYLENELMEKTEAKEVADVRISKLTRMESD